MKKVSIIGSGNVGVNSDVSTAENASANVTLVDIKEGISTGKALDLMEAAPIRRYRTKIDGSDEISAIAGSDIVVLAAGLVRSPGKDRSEHFKANSAITQEICSKIVDLAPDAIIIVATEPVDGIVKVVVQATGFNRNRVVGIGGILDSTRMGHFIAESLGVSAREVKALVIGSHTEKMVPLPFYSRVNGIQIDQLIDQETIENIITKTRDAGSVIVELSKRSNAYYAPSSAIAMVVDSICMDTKRLCSLSVLLDGEYGVSGVAMSVPCKMGANGVEKIIELDLDAADLDAFRKSAEPISHLN